MTKIHAQIMGEKVVLPRSELERLVAIARQSAEVELSLDEDDLPTAEFMRLAEQGGSFDFWKEPGEDIYTMLDGEPV